MRARGFLDGGKQRFPVPAHEVQHRQQPFLRTVKWQQCRAGALELPQLVGVAPLERPDIAAFDSHQLKLDSAAGALDRAAQRFFVSAAKLHQRAEVAIRFGTQAAQQ